MVPRLESQTGDVFLCGEKANNDGMLFRALTISALLHLFVLLGGQINVWSGSGAEKRPSLRAMLFSGQSPKGADAGTAPTSRGQLTRRQPNAGHAVVKASAARLRENLTFASSAVSHRTEAVANDRDALSEDGLRQYRLDLARAAHRHLPHSLFAGEKARLRPIMLRVRSAKPGELPGVELVISSGEVMLDTEVQALMKLAVRDAGMPAGVAGHAFDFELPIEYFSDD